MKDPIGSEAPFLFEWRVSKYNPKLRDKDGIYRRKDWSAPSEIGQSFEGNKLTASCYVATENAYIESIVRFCEESNVSCLEVVNEPILPTDEWENLDLVYPGKSLSLHEVSLVLRFELAYELPSVALESPGRDFYIHVGYDMLVYVGSQSNCSETVGWINNNPCVFVEDGVRSSILKARAE